ncbi:MAG: carboxypeptidase regulatory-like domain-containing protein [Planctomycetes bacterium]|nr:carboxypeptidase regulatory-like domain-containing protein [Planctomycetota bacterium]
MALAPEDAAPSVSSPITAHPPRASLENGSLALRELDAADSTLVLRGGCRSHEGLPLTNVSLTLALAESAGGIMVSGADLAAAHSDASGAFRFENVLRRGDRYVLSAAHPELGQWRSELVDPLRRTTLWQDVVLGYAGVIDGRIQDGSGNGISGAELRCENNVRSAVPCAGDGTFHITSVPPEGLLLRVSVTGFRSVTRLAKPGEACVFELMPGLAVAGAVLHTDSREPVVGARLTLRPTDGGSEERSESTDARGAFRFEGAAPGVLLLSVDGVAASARNVTAGAEHQLIEVRFGPRVDGVLLAADGKPARCGRVALVPFLESAAGALPLHAWQPIDAEGHFSLQAREVGTCFVVAEGPGSARVSSGPVQAPGRVQLQFAAGTVVHGHVQDERGSAIEGAVVVFRRVVLLRATATGSGVAAGVGSSTQVVSAADGSFACSNLASAEYDFEILHPSYVGRALPRQRISGAEVSLGDVALGRAGELEGLVLNKAGHADDTAVVLLLHAGGERHTVSSDALGKFSKSGLKPGVWQASVVQSEGVLRESVAVSATLNAGGRAFVRLESR